LVEKPWFVHEIKFDQNAGKPDFSKINPYYVTHNYNMASDKSFVELIVDQIENAGQITFKKMFGEYAVYCRED
jgi:hypothetical protein